MILKHREEGEKQMKILNFGSLNIDYVYKVEEFVKAGETISSKKLDVYSGGKGLNQSIAIAKSGVKVYHAGKIGQDGVFLKKELENAKVDTTYLLNEEGPTGHAIIQVNKEGQNSILLFGGANENIWRKEIDGILKGFNKEDIILLQCEINNLDYIVDECHKKGMTVILNPSPVNEHLKEIDISKVSYIILNEIEGQLLSGESEEASIIKKLLDKYKNLKVVLTLGERGVIYADGENYVKQDIFKTKVVDTTAAGDTFTGYFISGLVNNLSIEECLKRAAMASSIAVSRHGASQSIPTIEEVKVRFELRAH